MGYALQTSASRELLQALDDRGELLVCLLKHRGAPWVGRAAGRHYSGG
jgi:hypothetical protein